MSGAPLIDRDPSPAKLRGLASVFVGAAALAALHRLLVREDPRSAAVVCVVGLVAAAATFVPGLGRRIYVAWMSLGVALGRITSPILLALLYACVVVPFGLLGRLLGRDRLRRARPEPGVSLWEPPEPKRPDADYFRPF